MIGTTTNTAEYVGNASTVTAYTIPFRFDDPSWVKIVATDSAGVRSVLALTTDYLLAGSGPASTGTFTTVAAIPATTTLTVYREAPGLQTLDLETGEPLPSASVEAQLDRLAMAAMDRVTARAMEARIREIELTPGPAGATGATGATGSDGPEGPTGPPGAAGTNGTDATVTNDAVLAVLGLFPYANLSVANSFLPSGSIFYNLATSKLDITTA